ncbi:MAG: hypothetical protein QM503_06635 [Bacteroidota bacterium]
MELALTTGKRKIKDGSRFNHLFPPEMEAYGSSTTLKASGNVYDTVKYIARIIDNDSADTEQIAKHLEGDNRLETIKNIHDFMVDYLQYDTEKGEKLRSPRRTWWVGQKQIDKETGDSGVDCDDLVIFSGSILKNLNIPFFIRIVKVNQDEYQHVYLIVPPSGEQLSGTYITLDGVLSDFDYEYPFKQEKTFNQLGMKIEYLGAISSSHDASPGDKHTTINSTDPILAILVSLYNNISTRQLIPQKIQANELLSMLHYAIINWNTQNRLESLRFLSKVELGSSRDYTFFTKLYDHLTNQQYSNGLKGGDMYKYPLSDYLGDDPDNDNGNNKGQWADAITAAFTALANFDWGLVNGQNQNTYPPVQYQTPPTGTQIAGMSISTIGGLFLLGGMGYLLYENLSMKKSSPRISKK